jgi:protein-arginine deiminase
MIWNGVPARRLYIVRIGRNRPWDPHRPGSPDSSTASVIHALRRIFPQPGFLRVIAGADYRGQGGVNRWVQDWLEIGEIRGPEGCTPALVESAWAPRSRRSGLTFARGVLARGGILCAARNSSRVDLDRFGNLGVSPPLRVHGKDFPFGRIFYGGPLEGRRMNSRFLRFLREQSVQHPFEIDVSWLSLGHVDEVACFIPANGKRGFRLLLASPALAMKLLRGVPAGERKDSTLCTGRLNGRAPFVTPAQRTVHDFLEDREHCTYNERTIAGRMEGVRAKMIRELGLARGEILDVPVLFTRASSGRARPLTGNMVNLRVVVRRRSHLLVPKPFGLLPPGASADLFESWFKSRLGNLGNRIHFLDTWYAYHVGCGDIHCGTVTLRRSPSQRLV